MGDHGKVRVYYRLLPNSAASIEDFMPHKERGIPLRNPSQRELWESGISVFGTREGAIHAAARIRNPQMRYLACLSIPEEFAIRIEQTGRWPHYTIFNAAPGLLLQCITGSLEEITLEVRLLE